MKLKRVFSKKIGSYHFIEYNVPPNGLPSDIKTKYRIDNNEILTSVYVSKEEFEINLESAKREANQAKLKKMTKEMVLNILGSICDFQQHSKSSLSNDDLDDMSRYYEQILSNIKHMDLYR